MVKFVDNGVDVINCLISIRWRECPPVLWTEVEQKPHDSPGDLCKRYRRHSSRSYVVNARSLNCSAIPFTKFYFIVAEKKIFMGGEIL